MVGALLLGTADAALCEPMGDETLTRRVAMARRMQAETQEALKVIKPR